MGDGFLILSLLGHVFFKLFELFIDWFFLPGVFWWSLETETFGYMRSKTIENRGSMLVLDRYQREPIFWMLDAKVLEYQPGRSVDGVDLLLFWKRLGFDFFYSILNVLQSLT